MKEGFKNRCMLFFTMALVAVIVVGGSLFALPTYNRRRTLLQRDMELRAQIEAKQRQIAKLSENQRRFRSDPDFVESIARQNRRVFPGELVFILED
jgi:cell division protein FtsB